ncbi:MAG: hypothetical protein GY797_34750 [Deltaproteobacteria bacterium]|nr:hypothetical protein [Deltaproteobacteria bacterium]
MNLKTQLFSIVFILGIISCTVDKKADNEPKTKYIMDMVYNNLGLPPRVSEFNNPEYVKGIGFNGMTPHWYVQCGITYDSLEKGVVPENSLERIWIKENAATLNKKIKEAKKAGVKLYPFTDFLVVPKSVWQKYGKQMVADEFVDKVDLENYRKPDIRKEMTKKILRIQIAEIFETFPDLDGLMLRFGETYLHDTPYHLGNSPVRSKGAEGIEGHIEMIKLLREEVCVKRNKKLFYRTWDFGNFFHVNPQVYLSITNSVEPHENMIFCVKHVAGDFWRTIKFNPTLAIGKHQQIVEVQCQREYEGKGAHPDYIAKSVINGFEEYEYLMKPEQTQCLNDIKDSGQFAGVWTWSRGGGWLGPHLKNEFWCEQNAYVMAKWAQNTSRPEEEIFTEFAKYKGFSDDDIPKLREISLLSTKAVLRGRHSKYGDLYVNWTRDQFIHGAGSLKGFFDHVIKNDMIEKVLAEKKESVDMWKRMVELAQQIHTNDEALDEFLSTSTEYGRIKYEIFEKGWIVMLLGRIGDETGEYDKERIRKAIVRYDELWIEWNQLEETSPSCASIYEPNGSASRGHLDIYGNPETGIGASVDKYRKI